MALWRILVDGEPRVAVGPVSSGPEIVLASSVTIGGLLAEGPGAVEVAALGKLAGTPFAGEPLLPPCDGQEIWAAGVTFERSRAARGEESDDGDVYDRVYVAARPELFLKATARNVRGPGDALGIRPDSDWNVPEGELALALSSSGELAGFTIGNDMSSRSIEGENPLYLPQAKVYEASCGLGPAIVCPSEAPDPQTMEIRMAIARRGVSIYQDATSVSKMKRSLSELSQWLMRGQRHPAGVFLLCGTSLVPPDGVTLEAGDVITVSLTGLGRLTNSVMRLADNPNVDISTTL
jgi:2-dehydro-3-deoxy-D-arabinonate dehydratase